MKSNKLKYNACCPKCGKTFSVDVKTWSRWGSDAWCISCCDADWKRFVEKNPVWKK